METEKETSVKSGGEERFHALFSLGYSSTLKTETICSSETSVHLHGVTYQKVELFITTAVRISNHTPNYACCPFGKPEVKRLRRNVVIDGII
jgi:hypothetical protein